MNRLHNDFKKILYVFMRRFYWCIPIIIRSRLQWIRYSLSYWFRRHVAQEELEDGDLAWHEFLPIILQNGKYPVIIFELNVDWNIVLIQRPHQMALALGRLGCLVIFKTVGDISSGYRHVADNVWLSNDESVDDISGAIRIFYSTSLLACSEDIWAAKKIGFVIYEYIDHIDASISGTRSNVRRLLAMKKSALDGGADLVVASSSALYSEAMTTCKGTQCLLLPNGVDVEHYRLGRLRHVEFSEALMDFRVKYSRVVGYFGAIAPWLWYESLAYLAKVMPDVGFMLIGPDYNGSIKYIPRSENIFYNGAVNYELLPAFANIFDVCFIPFKPGPIAQATSPLKLYEYFSLEKPVVVTADMYECLKYPEVFVGNTPRELRNAISKAFEVCSNTDYKEKMRALAEANSWDIRANMYLDVLEKCII